MAKETRTLKYYEDRRAEIISLLEIPFLPADYRKMLENAQDFATDRIRQLQDIADMGGVEVPERQFRRLQSLLRTINTKRRRHYNETKIHRKELP